MTLLQMLFEQLAIQSIVLKSDTENYNSRYCKTRLYIRHSLIIINRTLTIFAVSSKHVHL